MTDKQCYAQAIEDYEYLYELFYDKTFPECIDVCKRYNFDFFYNEDKDLFDLNFGSACFTINNINGKGVVNENSIEVWNDEQGNCLGNWTLEKLKGEIE